MKLSPIVNKALSKRGIVLRHAPIAVNEKLIVPSQDKNDLISYTGVGRKMIVVKYGFTDEEEGNCAFLILHIENVERVIDLCPCYDDATTPSGERLVLSNQRKMVRCDF